MTTRYTIDQNGSIEEQIRKLKKYPEIANRHFMTATQKSLFVIQGAVLDAGVPVGVSGHLRESLGTSIENKGLMNITGRFGTSIKDSPYPMVMERGMDPGTFPPPSALMLWVKRKINPESWKLYSVAFNVARAIKAHGIKGHFFMARGWKAARPKVDNYFQQAAENTIKELVVRKK